MAIDRDFFFDGIREPVFHGMTESQVEGCNSILAAWESQQPTGDLRHLGYMSATAWWETAHTMQPIKEEGSAAYFTRMYDIRGARPDVARALGNTEPGDGAKFCGRGLPQTTGRKNYAWASTVIGKDCVADPDELLNPDSACRVMFAGMLTGAYTGKKLSTYIAGAHADYVNARRIINGTDKAATIAAAARIFVASLRSTS